MHILIHLVGTNPLPNYIATKILCNDMHNTLIYLVCTKKDKSLSGTEQIAMNLKEVLVKEVQPENIKTIYCDRSDFNSIKSIFRVITSNLNEDIKEITLNYTGGTKVMGSVFYQQLKNLEASNKFSGKIAYCYLDGELKKLFKEQDNEICGISWEQQGGTVVKQISLNNIVNMHGYQIKSFREKDIEKEIYHDIELTNLKNEIFVNKLSLKGFDMYFEINKELGLEKKADYKFHLFKAIEEAKRMGGDHVKVRFLCDFKDPEKLKKDITESYKTEGEDNVEVIRMTK